MMCEMEAHIDPDRESDVKQARPEETLALQSQTHRLSLLMDWKEFPWSLHDIMIYNKVSLTEKEGKPKSF